MQCTPSIMWGPHARPEVHLQEALPYATADLTLRASTPSNRHTEQRTIARVVEAHTKQGARHRAHCALAEHSNPNRAQMTECMIICNAPPVMELRVKYPGLTCTNGRDSQPTQPPDRPSHPSVPEQQLPADCQKKSCITPHNHGPKYITTYHPQQQPPPNPCHPSPSSPTLPCQQRCSCVTRFKIQTPQPQIQTMPGSTWTMRPWKKATTAGNSCTHCAASTPDPRHNLSNPGLQYNALGTN
jgi:hypothetical protein